MKLKILSIFFVVLIAQTSATKKTPLGPVSNIETDPNLIKEAVVAATNTLNDTLPLSSDVLNTVVQTVGHLATQATADLDNAIGAGRQLVLGSDDFKSYSNPGASLEAHLKNVARHVFQNIGNTIKPISKFNTGLSSLFSNHTVLLKNPIGSIKQSIARLKSTIKSAGLLKTAANLAYQVDDNALANPLTEHINFDSLVNFAVGKLPNTISLKLTALDVISDNIGNVLTAASSLANVLARQSGKGTKLVSTSVLPITTASSNSVNDIANAVISVPATINNAINSLKSAVDEIEACCPDRLQEVVSALTSIATGCVNGVLNVTYGLVADAISKEVLCVTDEIPTLQNYLDQYQNFAAQYQAGIANNTINISNLLQTVRTSIEIYSYVITVKFRVEGCIAATALKASGTFIPVAISAFDCVA